MGQELTVVPKVEVLPADIDPEVRTIVENFHDFKTITTMEVYELVVDTMTDARRAWQAADAKRKEETAELQKTIDIISEPYKFIVKIMKMVDEECKKQLNAYDRKIEQERRDQQALLNRQIAEENRQRAAEAEEKGELPALAAPAIVATIPKTIVTSSGSTQTKAKGRKDFTINGLTSEEIEGMSASDPRLLKIPREFLEPSMKRLKAAAQNDIPVCDDFQTFETFDYRLPSKKKG